MCIDQRGDWKVTGYSCRVSIHARQGVISCPWHNIAGKTVVLQLRPRTVLKDKLSRVEQARVILVAPVQFL